MPAPRSRVRRASAGTSYPALLLGLAILTIVGAALGVGVLHGMRLARLIQARSQALNAAEAELERLRGVPFEHMEGYAVQQPDVMGAVTVERLTERRKRVTVTLRHARALAHPVTLVTDVHRQGLPP